MNAEGRWLHRWVLRPGRGLALMQAAALWPVWIGAFSFDRALRHEPGAVWTDVWVFRAAIGLVGLCALAAYMGHHPRGLTASAERGVGPMARLIGLGLCFALAGFRWQGVELDAMMLSGGAAAVGGALYLGLGAVVARWPGGVLRRDERGPYLEGAHHRFLLAEWPGECEEGETLWLPTLQMSASGDGPYRRGRALGRSDRVIRDPDGHLVDRLIHHGVLLEAWALTTLSWAVLSRLG